MQQADPASKLHAYTGVLQGTLAVHSWVVNMTGAEARSKNPSYFVADAAVHWPDSMQHE